MIDWPPADDLQHGNTWFCHQASHESAYESASESRESKSVCLQSTLSHRIEKHPILTFNQRHLKGRWTGGRESVGCPVCGKPQGQYSCEACPLLIVQLQPMKLCVGHPSPAIKFKHNTKNPMMPEHPNPVRGCTALDSHRTGSRSRLGACSRVTVFLVCILSRPRCELGYRTLQTTTCRRIANATRDSLIEQQNFSMPVFPFKCGTHRKGGLSSVSARSSEMSAEIL